MNIPSIEQLLKSKLLIAGLVFLGVNLWASYMFYQVNSYKIALVVMGVSLMAILNDLVFPGNVEKKIPWKLLGIVALPLIATIPGFIWYQGAFNYNFRYELAANLILIVWVSYLYRGVKNEEDLSPFIFLIGITIIYASVWAILEKIGFHPLFWYSPAVGRVKSTFGNINYFAGFLVVIIPLFLALSFPEKIFSVSSFKEFRSAFSKSYRFFLVVFGFGGLSLFLTQTRAAMAAGFLGMMLVGYLIAITFSTEIWRKRLTKLLVSLIVLGIVSGILLFVFADQLQGSRIAQLFTLEGWVARLGSWQAAINSIKASPIIGFGLGSSYNLYFAFGDSEARLFSEQHSYNHVHSEILEYIQESGVLGLVLFLCFWGYLAFQLIKAIRADSTSPVIKKLAIGVLGGIVGYHFHGTFSVAPRMMVTKLPLFTLIGLAFIIIKLRMPLSDGESSKSFKQRLQSFTPAFLVIIGIWIVYLPWVFEQYQFVKIQRERPSLLKVENLEKLVEPGTDGSVLNLLSHQDAYALDSLSHYQIRYHRTKQLQNTVNIIDEVLPNYRELGHTKAVLAVMQKDLDKAIKQGLKFQNQDRYYSPTISLLLNLAVETNNSQLFYQQFQLFVRKQVFDKSLVSSRNSQDVEIQKKKMREPFIIQDKGGKIIIQWNEKLIAGLFNAARFNRKNRSYSAKDRNKFVSSLLYLFSRHPYFQINIFQQYREKGTKTIKSSMKSYFRIKRELDKKSLELTKKHRRQMARTIPANRPALQKKHTEEREISLKPYQDEIEPHVDLLTEKTDWVLFLKKRNFANGFIKEIINVIFPQSRK